jgi:hypothetical protein
MNSRYWRTLVGNFIASLLLEYAVALVIAAYFNDGQNLWAQALLILIIIWAVQILITVKNLIVSTAWYYLVAKRKLIGQIETTLRQKMFPVYEDDLPDAAEYLSRVTQDPASSLEQITYSAASLGQIEILKAVKPSAAWRTMATFEAALDRYRRHPAGVILR